MSPTRVTHESSKTEIKEDPSANKKPATGVLVVRVLRESNESAVKGATVSILDESKLTDRKGQARFELFARRYLVKVSVATVDLAGDSGWIHVEEGEEKLVTLRLKVADALNFYGRIVSAQQASGILGLQLELQFDKRMIKRFRTGVGGAFHVTVADASKAAVNVVDEAWSPIVIAVMPGHQSPGTAMTVTLLPSAALAVRLSDKRGSVFADAVVELRIYNSSLTKPQGQYRPPFARVWNGKSDASGRVEIRKLPAKVPLMLSVTWKGQRYFAPKLPVFLESGPNARDLTLPAWSSVEGTVVDQHGHAVADVRIGVSKLEKEENPSVMPWRRVKKGETAVTTDEQGHFHIDGLPAGKCLIGLLPKERSGRDKTDMQVSLSSVTVELPEGGAATRVVIRVWRGLYIEGHAKGPDGRPVAGIYLDAEALDTGYYAGTDSAKDGSFRLGPLTPATYAINSDVFDSKLGLLSPVLAVAGAKDVELRLVLVAGSIIARAVDQRTGRPVRCVIMFRQLDGDDAVGSRSDLDGSLRFKGLRAGTWTVTARDQTGLTAFLPNVQILPGSEIDVQLSMKKGAQLLLVHKKEKAPVTWEVMRGGVIYFEDFLAAPGIPGSQPLTLPAGRWTLRFLVGGKESFKKELYLRAGDALKVGPR